MLALNHDFMGYTEFRFSYIVFGAKKEKTGGSVESFRHLKQVLKLFFSANGALFH